MRGRVVALAAVLLLAGACTGGGGDAPGPSASPTPEPWRGGTLRLAMVGGDWWRFDPQREPGGPPFEVFRCCLLRTLFSYNGLPTAEGGAEARPDLAAGPPEVSADGLTWTFRIKPGLHYAPPLEDVEITAGDFIRALMREASPGSRYPYPLAAYFSIIEGFDAYAAGKADTISGLETPDEHTLVIRLSEPAGDLPNRFAIAATAPIPPNPHRPEDELGAAEGHPKFSYGHFLVASGPYMIEGSEDLDLSLPADEQRQISGYSNPRRDEDYYVVEPGSLTLVRNPSWDPSTDDLRAALADRIEFRLMGQFGVYGGGPAGWVQYRAAAEELRSDFEAGELDLVMDLPYTARQIRGLRADPEMAGRVTSWPTAGVWYLSLDLTAPPFDDLHVRKAVAFAIDRDELMRAVLADPRTRSSVGREAVVATHIAPDAVEADLLVGFDPYPTSLVQAKREMALSRYDLDGDGVCDAPECAGVLALARDDGFGSTAAEEVAERLEAIGIRLRIRMVNIDDFYARLADGRQAIPLGMGSGWSYVYANASDVFPGLFSGSELPSVDDRISRCEAMTGRDQTACWAELDRYLMERVVPIVPYMTGQSTHVVSERVASSSYCVATGELALDRIALVEGSG